MRTSNPILKDSVLETDYALTERPMSVSGTLNKLLLLALIMLFGAGAVYYQFSLQRLDYVNMLTMGGVIVGFIVAIVIAIAHKATPYLAPVYAFAQGAALSGISCYFESQFQGIVIQAISMTFVVVILMALLFKAGIIKATEKYRAVVFCATAAIGVFYLIAFILMLFHVNIPYFSANSNITIIINAAIAIFAALNLILDFDFIERGSQAPLPALYEWYGAFGLLVTILWLYLEILRLLSRVRNR